MPGLVEIQKVVFYAPERLPRLEGGEGISVCPFCPGNESLTPPELWAYNPEGWLSRTPDIPGWEVRIIPNKYSLPGTLDSEVVIFAPNHDAKISSLSLEQLRKSFFGIRERFQFHEQLDKAPLFYINEGKLAGATRDHPHGQLVTLRPDELATDWLEEPSLEQIILDDESFILYCPSQSEFTLEMILRPKGPEGSFSLVGYDGLEKLAKIFKTTCLALENLPFAQKLAKKSWDSQDVPYNVHLKGGVFGGSESWYLRFCPRLTIPAGYEQTTGRIVNIVPPPTAASLLKEGLASLSA